MSVRSGRVVVVVVAIAVGMQGLPAAGAESQINPPPQRAKHAQRVAQDVGTPGVRLSTEGHRLEHVDQPQSPVSMLEQNGGVTRPTAWLATVEDLVEQRHDVDVVNPLGDVDLGSDPSAGSHAPETYRDAGAAGDLDGDGLDDVVVLETASSGAEVSMDVAALRGSDGSAIWRRTIGDASGLAIPVGDLTADGSADLLLASVEVSRADAGGCAPLLLACAISVDSTWVWTTELVSGSDGASVWSRQQPGGVEEVYADGWPLAALVLADVYRATGVLVVPMLGADRDGDGAMDIVESYIDLQGELFLAFAPFVFGYVSRLQTATAATVVSGRSGTAYGSLQTELRDGVSILLPAGRSVGDETPDVLWTDVDWSPAVVCAAVVLGACFYDETASARLVDGATLEDVWQTNDYDSYAYVTPLDDDLDADGSDDVLVDHSWNAEVSVLSGSTGSNLWTAEGWNLGTVASIDGDDASDVITVRAEYYYDPGAEGSTATIHTDRLDGATGALRFSTATEIHENEGEYISVSVGMVGDGDGDGVDDVGMTIERNDRASGESSVTGSVESSAAGGEIFQTTAVRGGFFTYLVDAGDLDGDGRDDVIIASLDWASDGDHLSIAAAGANGPLWHQAFAYDWVWSFDVLNAGHLMDASSDDVLFVRDVNDDASFTTLSRIDALDGATGAAIWGLGDDLPDVAGLGSISGTVVDLDGNRVDGVCVDAYDSDGSQVAGVFTSAGDFVLTRLRAGTYRLLLEDCDGRYDGTRTWFELKDSFEDADVIEVGESEEVTGLKATLPIEISRPPNDAFADAEALAPGTRTANTVNATLEDEEPRPCGAIGSTVWFSYTAPADGAVVVATTGSSFDTVLAAYTGTTLDDLEEVACNDDTTPDLSSMVAFDVEAGTTYLVQAGGYRGDAGDLVLSVAGGPA